MISSLFFIFRITVAWLAAYLALAITLHETLAGETDHGGLVGLGAGIVVAIIFSGAFSHVRRVRLIAGTVNPSTLSRRQRRQIEFALEAGEAFGSASTTAPTWKTPKRWDGRSRAGWPSGAAPSRPTRARAPPRRK